MWTRSQLRFHIQRDANCNLCGHAHDFVFTIRGILNTVVYIIIQLTRSNETHADMQSPTYHQHVIMKYQPYCTGKSYSTDEISGDLIHVIELIPLLLLFFLLSLKLQRLVPLPSRPSECLKLSTNIYFVISFQNLWTVGLQLTFCVILFPEMMILYFNQHSSRNIAMQHTWLHLI